MAPEVQRSFCSWACWVGTAAGTLAEAPCRLNVMSHLKNEALGKIKDRSAMLAGAVAMGILFLLPGIHGFWQGGKVEAMVAPQKEEVDQAEALSGKLQASSKAVQAHMDDLESAVQLEQERLRWPILLEELASKSKTGMWITKLAVIDGQTSVGDSVSSPKAPGGRPATTLIELSGIFESKSEDADARVVDDFCKSLEQGGVFQKVVTVERETPERSPDGKLEQVALKFTVRGEWLPVGGTDSKSGDKTKKP